MPTEPTSTLSRRAVLRGTLAAAALALALRGAPPSFAASRRRSAVLWSPLPDSGERPCARADHSLNYAPDTGLLYLFGGQAHGAPLDDLWAYDPAAGAWSRLDPPGRRPAPRFGHNAAYDPARRRLIVALGQEAVDTFLDDTWAFDPAAGAWRDLTPAGDRPKGRYGAASALDPTGDRLFITHGFTNEGRFDDTWAFDLASETWAPVATAGAVPLKRCLARAAWDPAAAQILLFGGQTTGRRPLGDLWALDPASGTWAERRPPDSPTPRNLYAAASSGERWLVFGGFTAAGADADLWVYDPAADAWYRLDPTGGDAPAPRMSADLTAASDRLFLFGGNDAQSYFDDLWALFPTAV
jgi:hypothetical protein